MQDNNVSLIERIYEAALVPELWPTVLGDVAHSVGGFGALLAVFLPDGRNHWVTSSPEMDDVMRAHVEYYPQNARTARLLSIKHSGFLVDEDVFSQMEMDNEPIYQEYLRPQGFGFGSATAIYTPSGDATVLHVEGRQADGPISSRAVSRLNELRPHLARASLLANRLELDRARSAITALEILGLPAAVVTQEGRALAANLLFQNLMPTAVQDLPSRLKLMEAGADKLFEEALASGSPSNAVRSIPMRALGHHPPVVFHLAPVHGSGRDIFSRANALLIATPLVPKQPFGASLIEGLFDLTPSEAKLATLVAGNHPPRDAARMLGWTEDTARTTLKKVFAKTGVNRQSEVVALLGRL